MIDIRLYEARDECFSEIHKGDLVFIQTDDGGETVGRAVERTWMGWMVEGGQEVIEDENYLGHIGRAQLTGVAA